MKRILVPASLILLVFVSLPVLACAKDEPQIEMKQTGPQQVRTIKATKKVEYIVMRGDARFNKEIERARAKKGRMQLVQNRAPANRPK